MGLCRGHGRRLGVLKSIEDRAYAGTPLAWRGDRRQDVTSDMGSLLVPKSPPKAIPVLVPNRGVVDKVRGLDPGELETIGVIRTSQGTTGAEPKGNQIYLSVKGHCQLLTSRAFFTDKKRPWPYLSVNLPPTCVKRLCD